MSSHFNVCMVREGHETCHKMWDGHGANASIRRRDLGRDICIRTLYQKVGVTMSGIMGLSLQRRLWFSKTTVRSRAQRVVLQQQSVHVRILCTYSNTSVVLHIHTYIRHTYIHVHVKSKELITMILGLCLCIRHVNFIWLCWQHKWQQCYDAMTLFSLLTRTCWILVIRLINLLSCVHLLEDTT